MSLLMGTTVIDDPGGGYLSAELDPVSSKSGNPQSFTFQASAVLDLLWKFIMYSYGVHNGSQCLLGPSAHGPQILL